MQLIGKERKNIQGRAILGEWLLNKYSFILENSNWIYYIIYLWSHVICSIFLLSIFSLSSFVSKCVQGRISVREAPFRPYRNSYNTSSSLGDPLFAPQYLVMHSRQSILYRESKIYNDVPMEIKSLNNPE